MCKFLVERNSEVHCRVLSTSVMYSVDESVECICLMTLVCVFNVQRILVIPAMRMNTSVPLIMMRQEILSTVTWPVC